MIKTAGSNKFSPISGATSITLDLGAATLAENRNQYEAVFHNGSGPDATTTAATLTVNPASAVPKITLQPQSQTRTVGQSVTFTATATGNPMPTVQWMVEVAGSNKFVAIKGATSTTLSLGAATLGENGNKYEAVFKNSVGTVTTSVVTLTVKPAITAPHVTVNPQSQAHTVGQSVVFTAAAAGSPNPTVQWMVETAGAKSFSPIRGATFHHVKSRRSDSDGKR